MLMCAYTEAAESMPSSAMKSGRFSWRKAATEGASSPACTSTFSGQHCSACRWYLRRRRSSARSEAAQRGVYQVLFGTRKLDGSCR